MKKTKDLFWIFVIVFLAALLAPLTDLEAGNTPQAAVKVKSLRKIHVASYSGGADGGLAHVTYWGIKAGNPYYDSLSPEERIKADKINRNYIHAAAFQPVNADIAGMEVTGFLKVGKRRQSVTFRLPTAWNGKLVVGGTPGLRNEYANEAILIPWLLEAGSAYIAGDKGIPGGVSDMLSGKHPTQYWGQMMIDLAVLGKKLLRVLQGTAPDFVYAMGLSNGGYQIRRALEIDHKRVRKGRNRLFDGGVDWSGAYWPDKRVLDVNGDGKVAIKEYAQADTLINSIDKATMAMRWFRSPDTLATETEYAKDPRFPGAYFPMINTGFSPASAIYWGYYSSNFDPFQAVPGFEIYRGVGYYNLVSYVYRAELRGDDEATAAAYTCWSDPDHPDTQPAIYNWLTNAADGGWTLESIQYALKNANSGVFSAPLLSLHGQADGLVALNAQAMAYEDAVEQVGNPQLYRLYIIAHAGHVDHNADGGWGASSALIDPNIPDRLTPMQAYAVRTFDYLVGWVERGEVPPESKLVETDPANDVTDPNDLSW